MMSTVARLALEKLLRSAENASAKEQTGRSITIKLSDKSFPRYLALETHATRLACHGELELAERDGVIKIDWERQAGEKRQIERLTLLDPAKLAKFLGVVPRWDAVSDAQSKLSEYFDQFPLLREVIDLWRRGMKPRGTSTADINDWIDSIRVVKYCMESNSLDVPVRRLSTMLTFDSKRVEGLWYLIDALLQGDLRAPQRSPEEVFGEIGLIKFPPTLLIAGSIRVLSEFCGEHAEIEIVRPYLGMSPEAISGFAISENCIVLLTVENLTTFHEMAAITESRKNKILLYTGGMPSPSWKRIYKLLLKSLPPKASVFHWGDIDAGGFRIASHLAQCCLEEGKTLQLHKMQLTCEKLQGDEAIRRELTEHEVISIEKICEKWGWILENQWASQNKVAIEQESLPVEWPDSNCIPMDKSSTHTHVLEGTE
ncbi:Wadjet anti-phage system protein JetD domain-containing protein [Candidatus Ferrigenium straubiae]|jgi:hypothetical protein|uniref:Wadjet anti-phage system protein JetD domain-containing protein n=1 Tax=Candidatus Ferrigenium straubiae TaxID=2919506 RepID=UPI003F4AA036